MSKPSDDMALPILAKLLLSPRDVTKVVVTMEVNEIPTIVVTRYIHEAVELLEETKKYEIKEVACNKTDGTIVPPTINVVADED